MAYIPDPTDVTNPLDTVDRSTAAAEFRALKTYLQAQLTALNAAIAAAITSAVNTAKAYTDGKVANLPTRVAWFTATNGVITASSGGITLTVNGVGDYTVTFATPFADANYAQNINISPSYGALNGSAALNTSAGLAESTPAVNSCRFFVYGQGIGAFSPKYISGTFTR